MADQINQVQPGRESEGSGFGSGLAIGLIIVVIIIALLLLFGLPRLGGNNTTAPAGNDAGLETGGNEGIPSEVDVNVEGGLDTAPGAGE